MITVHYALQTCDLESPHHKDPRYCNAPKTEVTKRCVRSFLESVTYAVDANHEAIHRITIFDDRSSQQTKDTLHRYAKIYSTGDVTVEVRDTKLPGLAASIRECYEHLRKCDGLVYQVQDDYLFETNAVYQSLNTYFQVNHQCITDPLVSPFNDQYYWQVGYHNRSTPRLIVQGNDRYWIQIYDISCSFLTSNVQFNKHWDLYEKFLGLIGTGEHLENRSLNYITTQRGVLAICPINTLAFHLQSNHEKDPYIDWKPLWDKYEI